MPTTEPLDRDEVARLGDELVARHVTPTLRPGDDGKFIAIDINTGDYELDDDDYSAVMRLRARRPAGELWLARAGYPTAYQMRRRI